MSAATLPSADLTDRRDAALVWMNRGHALSLQDDAPAALHAYAQAVALLRTLPVAENHAWANHLGAARMNLGQLLHRVHGLARAADALAEFDAALATLRPAAHAGHTWARRNLAGSHLNRANLLLDLGRTTDAVPAARAALALATPAEHADPVDADLALKARRALADALGRLLVAPHADQDALAAEASDLVDDALALIRFWSGRGVNAFQPLARRFLHYGIRLYQLHQPHFLPEFLTENLPLVDATARTAALEAIVLLLAERHHTILTVGDPVTERRLRLWRDLEALRPHFSSA